MTLFEEIMAVFGQVPGAVALITKIVQEIEAIKKHPALTASASPISLNDQSSTSPILD